MRTSPARRIFAAAGLVAGLAAVTGAMSGGAPACFPLAGTWTLVAADALHPDGTRSSDYGAAPKGLLMVDRQGRYSLQIFRAERPHFATGDKAHGSPAEYQGAVKGSSTHYGTLELDAKRHLLVFHIDGASFPNWEGQQQRRTFELRGDVLSYRVPPRPNGDVPISVWRRIGVGMAR
ncbi:lipocalin-like domain-containing protein [Dyella lutea]|uniref:Lipocalin-like domain-containing protein n=1 Tax=Dyella lutea TaxID=2950441 RepID=A0ABT1FBG7_9GAMM|nr:lipocalin-like domain-containing protein [Dyella lutea]MCP1374710.1 lipocalin-like domain-containing protein [Dyella lutea]